MNAMPGTMEGPVRSVSPAGSKAALTCRRMVEADLDMAVDLLAEGFPERSPDYWRRGLLRLRDRAIPDNVPRFGYVLSDGERLVGIILMIFATTDTGTLRGNVSSWYVAPAYRAFSRLLLSASLKLKNAVLFNVSPAPTTIETIRAQGFTQYANGTFQALAVLAPPVLGARVRQISASDGPSLLADHAACGCLSFEVSYKGETFPFVFQPASILKGKLACAQLIYCRDLSEFECFAGPLGRRLLAHGMPLVLIDANEPLAGFLGWFRAGRIRRFYRGQTAPRLGDLSYSELVVFGP